MHYKMRWWYNEPICERSKRRNEVTGKPEVQTCREERRWRMSGCSEFGHYFEPKEIKL